VTFDITRYRDLYPFTSRWLELDGVRMHYVDEGTGEPIVLVHGNPTWSFFYRRLIMALRDRYRVIAMDHVGCGLSDKPAAGDYPYTLDRRITDLDRLLDHLDLGNQLTFGVHDWGGMIGMACALRRAQNVKRLIVFNTAAFLMPAGERLPLRLRVIRDGGPIGAAIVQGLNGFCRGAAQMAVCNPLPRKVRRAYLAPYDTWAHRLAVLRFVQDIPLRPKDSSFATARWVDDHLHELAHADVLICWGERDFVFDAAYRDEWRRRFPDATVHTNPDAGHYVLEDAGDEVNHIVGEFLDGSRRASPNAEAVETTP